MTGFFCGTLVDKTDENICTAAADHSVFFGTLVVHQEGLENWGMISIQAQVSCCLDNIVFDFSTADGAAYYTILIHRHFGAGTAWDRTGFTNNHAEGNRTVCFVDCIKDRVFQRRIWEAGIFDFDDLRQNAHRNFFRSLRVDREPDRTEHTVNLLLSKSVFQQRLMNQCYLAAAADHTEIGTGLLCKKIGQAGVIVLVTAGDDDIIGAVVAGKLRQSFVKRQAESGSFGEAGWVAKLFAFIHNRNRKSQHNSQLINKVGDMTSAQQNKLWFWGKMLDKDAVTLKGNSGRKLLVWGQLLEKIIPESGKGR